MRIWNRYAKVVIGTKNWSKLRIDFEVTRTLASKPNKATISIFNLNDSSRAYIAENQTLPAQIDAGYEDGFSTIFLGEVTLGFSPVEGEDIVTRMGCGDGANQLQRSRVSKAFAPNVQPADVLRSLAASLGVAKGNLDQAVTLLRVNQIARAISGGTVLFGSGPREMDHLCRAMGMSWSVQNGKLQLLEIGKALEGQAIRLTPQTGLYKSPSIDNKGVISFQCAMIKDMIPGRKVVIEARTFQAQCIVEQCVYRGTTDPGSGEGTEFLIDCQAKKY